MAIVVKGGRPPGLPKTGGRAKGTLNRSSVALREKLASLNCDPAGELVRIAQDSTTSTVLRAHIYSTLLPYAHPKRKPMDEADEERLTLAGQAISPEEALDLARDLIALFTPLAGAQEELPTPVNDGHTNSSVVERGDEN